MKRIGTIPSLLVLSVVTLLLFTNSCLPKSKPSTVTTIGGQERNVRELKSLIYELTAQLSGTIETATTAIQLETDDVEIERAALMFKAEAVPALLHASFRHDPIMAVADISLLTFQLQDWATTGPGRNEFGEMQHTVIEATQKMERQIIEFLEIESSQVAEDAIRSVRDFATEHPIEGTISTRWTAVGPLAERLRRTKMGAFASVTSMAESLDDLSDRISIYAVAFPKQARWQAELAMFDFGVTEPGVEGAFRDLNRLGTVSDRAVELIDDLPTMVDERLEEVAPAIESAVGSIDLEPIRAELDGMVSLHLEVALDAVTREREAALDAVSKEREIVLLELERLLGETMDRSFERVEAQIDVQIPRLVLLGIAVMAGPFVLGILAGIILVRRHVLP